MISRVRSVGYRASESSFRKSFKIFWNDGSPWCEEVSSDSGEDILALTGVENRAPKCQRVASTAGMERSMVMLIQLSLRRREGRGEEEEEVIGFGVGDMCWSGWLVSARLE